MKKNSLFISFLVIFLSLFVFSCSNLETIKTTSIDIRIPLKSIVENDSGQNQARAADSEDTATRENDSDYELRVTLNVDGKDTVQSAQGTTEELSDKVFTFSELPVGAVVLVSCDVLKEDKLIWSGKSEEIVISGGINSVEIKMKKVQQEEPPIDEPEKPDEEDNADEEDSASAGVDAELPFGDDVYISLYINGVDASSDINKVEKGSEIKFSVGDLSGTHTYQWYIDSAAVSGATEADFTWNTENVQTGSHNVMCVVDGNYSAYTTVTVAISKE